MDSQLHRPRRYFGRGTFLFALCLLLFAAGASGFYYWIYWPNGNHEKPDFGGISKPIFYRGEQLGLPALGEKESLKLPFSFYRDTIDPNIRYEANSQSVIITTEDRVVRLKTSQLTGMVNEKPFTLRFTVEKSGETVYLPVDPLLDYYRLNILESEETGAVVVRKEGDAVQWGKTIVSSKQPDRTKALRAEPTIKAPIYADLKADEPVMIWGEKEGWYKVQLKNGCIGYAKKTDILLDRVETLAKQENKKPFVSWKPVGGKINLTWQQVSTKNPDTAKIGAMPGLNVISPQWFHLADGEGNLKNLASPAFVKWAAANKYQIWALFSNGFEPKRTTEALATYDKRMKMIKQLVSFAQMYGLQGINVDFENVSLKDKENMVQFMREMTPLLHEQGLVVSIDVTVKDGSENYSLFMDRLAIGEVVDYMMVMTYDEHWASSPKAGSVASLPWVDKGIEKILKEDNVPASKLIIGVPYYTRQWTEQSKDGKLAVTSKTMSMEAVRKLVAEKKLTPALDADTGQNYVEFTEDEKTMKIWIEDSLSMKSRMEIMKKYDLAGVASWSRGLESSDIWSVIEEAMTKRP